MNEGKGWLSENWKTVLALVLIFGLALFLRLYFVYGLAFTEYPWTCGNGLTLPVSGGSDSYYWHTTLCWSFQTGQDVVKDDTLNYPLAMMNPRPPLYPWFALLSGRSIAPIFGGDAWAGVTFVFLISTALFGALTVFPTYLLTKEAFGRRAGLIAAFLLAISAAHMQRSQATDADHDAWTLFFVVTTFFFFIRALKTMQPRRWVENWAGRKAIAAGIRNFFRENRSAVLYAALAGLSITVVALSWQGWAYVVVILLAYFVAQLFIDRVRNRDPMGVTILFTVSMALPLLLAFPWYWGHIQIRVWFDVPAYLFGVALVLGIIFTVTRDYPWALVIPSVLIAGAVAVGIAALVNPGLVTTVLSGAGYFIQTKVYETIAEAQAPGISQVMLAFGWFTFFLSLGGVGYLLFRLPREQIPSYTLIAVWAGVSIFMTMSAGRFIFNGAPAFAVTAAFALDEFIKWAEFGQLRRTYRSLADGSWRNAVRKSVKIRHVIVVLALTGLILLPNVWYGTDAGIPFNTKSYYDEQVYNSLPPFLRSPQFEAVAQAGGLFYFGAFGFAVPRPNQYFPAAWQWYSTEDAEVQVTERPAFLSWWDYGFEAVDRGQHPTVADNFQNGVPFAGQFITSQNESQAVALLGIRLLEGDVRANGGTFSPAAASALTSFGIPPSEVLGAMLHPETLIPVVQGNPDVYGFWDARMSAPNAMYIYLAHTFSTALELDELSELYHALRAATGTDIGYFMVDTRLFPISATNTGIFYAPAKLADHIVVETASGQIIPTQFYEILAQTGTGSVPIQDVPPGQQIFSTEIQYNRMFYESMFYRTYIGYTPTELGLSGETAQGIPGFASSMLQYPPDPSWMLSHFRVVYRTAYYNPYTDPANHSDAWQAMNYPDALRIQELIAKGEATGVVDVSSQAAVRNGLIFLRYYDGALVNGTVRAAGTRPVSGVRITVRDEFGTPHFVTTTDASGRFSAVVPFGNITLTASAGAVTPTTQVGAQVFATIPMTITLGQALRSPYDSDGDGAPDWLLHRDIEIPGRDVRGTAYYDLNRNGVYDSADLPVPGARIEMSLPSPALSANATTDGAGAFTLGTLPDGTYRVRANVSERTIQVPNATVSPSSPSPIDLAIPFARMLGFARGPEGSGVGGATIELRDELVGTTTSAVAAVDGFYTLEPILTGNYTASASGDGLAALPAWVRATTGDRWLNLTLVPSGRVTGITQVFGTRQPFATLEFQSVADLGLVRVVQSDATGTYAVALPTGEWNVNGRLYQGSSVFAALARVTVRPGETTTLVATFVEASRVEGTVREANRTAGVSGALIIFSTPTGGVWALRSGFFGQYLVYLPRGAYAVQATSSTAAFYGSVSLTASRTLDLTMALAASATGIVYRDLDADGSFDDGEGIAGAVLNLVDDQGLRVLATTNASGEFLLLGFTARTYSGSISAFGYEPRGLPSSGLEDIRQASPFALQPTQIGASGVVLLGGSPLVNRPVTITARASGGGAVDATARTDTSGAYFITLIPGAYELVVDENVSGSDDRRYQNLGPDTVTALIGAPGLAHDVPIVERVLVRGNVTFNGTAVNATVTFRGLDVREVASNASGFQVYLQLDTYSTHASRSANGTEYAFLGSVALSGPQTLSLPLVRAIRVTGQASAAGSPVPGPMPVTFERTGGGSVVTDTSGQGVYAVDLVPGTYRVLVNSTGEAVENGTRRFYAYTFDGPLVVPSTPPNMTYDLTLQRSLDNTTVAGLVSYVGLPTDAVLTFTARGGGAIDATAAAAPDGTFSVGLQAGQYDVYAVQPLIPAAYLETVTIPHAATMPFDVALRPGVVLSGTVTDAQGLRTQALVTIRAGPRIERPTDASGGYQVLLPPGSYTVTASRTVTESGVDVEYRATDSAEVFVDRVVNLQLEKVVRRAVSLTWDSAQQQTIPAGGTVTYAIVVENTGNVADTYTFAGAPETWSFRFSPSVASVNFGSTGNRAVVSVAITAPPDALVDHGALTITATASDDATRGNVRVEVGILRYRGMTVRGNATTGVFDGSFLNYTVEARNTGNAPESLTVTVTNAENLATLGWVARVGTATTAPSGPQLTQVVAANSTLLVTLELRRASGPAGVTVALEVASEDGLMVDTTVLAASLPVLAATQVGASGPNIVTTPSVPWPYVAMAAAAAAAVLLGLFFTRRRRR